MQKPLLKEIEFTYGNHPKNTTQNDFEIDYSLESVKIKKISDFEYSSFVNYINKK